MFKQSELANDIAAAMVQNLEPNGKTVNIHKAADCLSRAGALLGQKSHFAKIIKAMVSKLEAEQAENV